MQLARNPLAARRARTLLGSRPCRPHGYGCQQSGGVYTALRSPNRKSGSRGLLSGRFILEAGVGFASRLYQPISRWHRRRVGRPRTSLRFSRPPGMRSRPLFTHAEATEIEAMASQIIPSNSTPGARSRRYLFHRPRARNFRSREARSLQERPGGPAEEDGGPAIQHWNVLRTRRASADRTPQEHREDGVFRAGTPAYHHGISRQPGVWWQSRPDRVETDGFGDRLFYQPPFGFYDRDYKPEENR